MVGYVFAKNEFEGGCAGREGMARELVSWPTLAPALGAALVELDWDLDEID